MGIRATHVQTSISHSHSSLMDENLIKKRYSQLSLNNHVIRCIERNQVSYACAIWTSSRQQDAARWRFSDVAIARRARTRARARGARRAGRERRRRVLIGRAWRGRARWRQRTIWTQASSCGSGSGMTGARRLTAARAARRLTAARAAMAIDCGAVRRERYPMRRSGGLASRAGGSRRTVSSITANMCSTESSAGCGAADAASSSTRARCARDEAWGARRVGRGRRSWDGRVECGHGGGMAGHGGGMAGAWRGQGAWRRPLQRGA